MCSINTTMVGAAASRLLMALLVAGAGAHAGGAATSGRPGAPLGGVSTSLSLSFSPPHYMGGAMWLSDSFWRLGPATHAVVVGALDLPAPRSAAPPHAAHRFTYKPNMMTAGHDACPPGAYTLADAEAHCIALPDCVGLTFSGNASSPGGVIAKVWFKNATALAGGGSLWHTYLLDYHVPW